MPIEQTPECIAGPSCPTGAAVVQVERDLNNLKNDVTDDRAQSREGRKALHLRIDTVEARFWGLLCGIILSALGSAGSLIVGIILLLAKK